MSQSMIKVLVLKDWYFNRYIIIGYCLAGLLSLLLVSRGEAAMFFGGSVLLVTVLVGLGIHLVIPTVINERAHKTLPFIMSMPIDFRTYTTAKLLANLMIFLVPWCALLIATFVIFQMNDLLPTGLIPFVVVVLTEILTAYCFILSVALVSESEKITIGAIVVSNLFLNYFFFYASRLPVFAENMKSHVMKWDFQVFQILGLELAIAGALLVGTYFLQARKNDFL